MGLGKAGAAVARAEATSRYQAAHPGSLFEKENSRGEGRS